jgi:hypothetical protein
MKCKIVKIVNSRGFPHLHIEINRKMYFYGISGVRADNNIVLKCNKRLSGSIQPCGNISTILPSDFLRKNIQKINILEDMQKFWTNQNQGFMILSITI